MIHCRLKCFMLCEMFFYIKASFLVSYFLTLSSCIVTHSPLHPCFAPLPEFLSLFVSCISISATCHLHILILPCKSPLTVITSLPSCLYFHPCILVVLPHCSLISLALYFHAPAFHLFVVSWYRNMNKARQSMHISGLTTHLNRAKKDM